MSVSSHGRVPRAHLDPIHSMADAISVFSMQMTRPLCPETLVMFLDENRCGSTLVTVSDTIEPSQMVDVAEAMALATAGEPAVSALVLATVRPGGGLIPGDDDLWLEAADLVEQSGLELVDWLIFGRGGPISPREQLGVRSRWHCGP